MEPRRINYLPSLIIDREHHVNFILILIHRVRILTTGAFFSVLWLFPCDTNSSMSERHLDMAYVAVFSLIRIIIIVIDRKHHVNFIWIRTYAFRRRPKKLAPMEIHWSSRCAVVIILIKIAWSNNRIENPSDFGVCPSHSPYGPEKWLHIQRPGKRWAVFLIILWTHVSYRLLG